MVSSDEAGVLKVVKGKIILNFEGSKCRQDFISTIQSRSLSTHCAWFWKPADAKPLGPNDHVVRGG